MAIKPGGGTCCIREQIIDDPVSGLSFQFELRPGSDAPIRMKIFGDLPNGNREILFNSSGVEAGAGTALGGPCRATWLKEV